MYFIFKLVPFVPESLPLSITGCSSLARASCAARVRLDHTHSGLLIKVARMRKFGSTRLRQLLAVKLTAAFSESCTIDVLPHRRLSDREYSAEDVYEVCSCQLVVRRNCRCDSALRHQKALRILMMKRNRALYKVVLRRIQE